MEALFEIFMIGGIIGGGAYLFLSWQEGRKSSIEEQDNKLAKEQMQSDKWISEAKTKMLGYYNNSPAYYWFQIIGFSLSMSVLLVLLIFIVDEYFSIGLLNNDNQLVALYLTCSALITISFHRHYQK